MKVEDRLRRAFALLIEAVKKDPDLARAVEEVLGHTGRDALPSSQPRNRRKPAAFDPFAVFEEGETALRRKLQALDVEGLKDIVSEYGLDPAKLVRKWKTADRIINHIVGFVRTRARKGDAFRN